MSGESRKTTDHDLIRGWAEKRGGRPAAVAGTGDGGDPGILRIAFDDDQHDGSLKELSWDEFFEKFEESGLCFLYQDQTKDGAVSRFSKFVTRG